MTLTTLTAETLRAELAKARAALEYAGAIRVENGVTRIVSTFAPATLLTKYRDLVAEASRRGIAA